MKKIFTVILIITILFGFEVAFANSIDLVIDSKTASPGDVITINVSLKNNTGFIAASLQLEYDSTRLKLTDAKDGGLLSGATFNPDYNKIPYTLLWNSATTTNFTGDGVLVALTFDVSETAPNGEATIKLSFNKNDVFDLDLNNVALNIVNGGITVIGEKVDNTTQNTIENEEKYFEEEPTNKPTNDITIHHSSVATSSRPESTNENLVENTKTELPAFSDANVGDWYYDAVSYVVKNKLMNGVSETTFAPNINLTRAMLVTILYRNENEPDVKKSILFTDVDTNSYYANAVNWAQINGIVSGISETTFAPDDNITREQIATIIYRYAKYKSYDVSNSENVNILSYGDSRMISAYANEAMQYAVGSGIITGKSAATLNPIDNATRAETATILMRFLESNK